jgi:hypothetical protein
VDVVGVCVLVGRFVLNVFVPVQAFVPAKRFEDPVVIALSTYVFVVSCVDVVGVCVLVGRFVLNVFVPVQAFVPARDTPPPLTLSTYVLLHKWSAVVGATAHEGIFENVVIALWVAVWVVDAVLPIVMGAFAFVADEIFTGAIDVPPVLILIAPLLAPAVPRFNIPVD